MKKVDCWVLVMNIIMTAFSATLTAFYDFTGEHKYYNADYVALMTFIYLILFGSVCSMRGTIKSLAYSFPNERLMCIHFVNFPIWILLSSIDTVLGMMAHTIASQTEPLDTDEKLKMLKITYAKAVVTNIQVPFSFWLGVWLLYLILKSTTMNDLDKSGVQDVVLGRKVPPIVFIKNRSLLKEILANDLQNDAGLRQRVRL